MIFVFAISAQLYIYIYIFSIRAFFHRHWQFIGQQGKGGHIFYSTLRIPLTHEHSDICLQLCMWYDYYVFLISVLVIVYSINSRKVFSFPTTKNISFVSRPRFAKFQFHFYQVMEAGKKGSGAVVHCTFLKVYSERKVQLLVISGSWKNARDWFHLCQSWSVSFE